MAQQDRQFSGSVIDEASLGAEFRDIVDTLFSCCLAEMQSRDEQLPRELFRLVEIEDRPLAEAAGALGLAVPEARETMARIRSDVAVLMVFGLCRPDDGPSGADRPNTGCRCLSASAGRGR